MQKSKSIASVNRLNKYGGPTSGDEDFPPDRPASREMYSKPRVQANAQPAAAKAIVAEDKLKTLLYSPPCSIEDLARKLQVSIVLGPSARVAQGAFVSRYNTKV